MLLGHLRSHFLRPQRNRLHLLNAHVIKPESFRLSPFASGRGHFVLSETSRRPSFIVRHKINRPFISVTARLSSLSSGLTEKATPKPSPTEECGPHQAFHEDEAVEYDTDEETEEELYKFQVAKEKARQGPYGSLPKSALMAVRGLSCVLVVILYILVQIPYTYLMLAVKGKQDRLEENPNCMTSMEYEKLVREREQFMYLAMTQHWPGDWYPSREALEVKPPWMKETTAEPEKSLEPSAVKTTLASRMVV